MNRARAIADTFAEYRAAPGENLSRLKLLADSPRRYFINPRKDSAAMSIGRAAHTAILEPGSFEDEYALWPTRRAGKKFEEFCLLNPAKQIMSKPEHDTVMRMRDAVNSHKVAREYFTEGVPEQSIFWTHPIGVECKSRVDWLRDDIILDLKSARSVGRREFASQAASLDYAAQLAFYHDAAKALDGRERKVVILAVENCGTFDVVPYVVPDEALQAGRRRYMDWLLLLLKCQAADHWPGVSDDETELHLPAWYFDEMDDATLVMPDGKVVSA